MKKFILTLAICLMAVTAAHAQTVVIQRPGIFTDLASATGAIIALPLAAVEGIVIGTAEAARFFDPRRHTGRCYSSCKATF